MGAPNRRDVIERLARENPQLFDWAHEEGNPRRWDFIKLAARVLYREDPRFGLNGKRGNPNDISMDVITFRLGPTDRHVEAFDVIGGAGGSNPQPQWTNITNYATLGQENTAIWIKPEDAEEPPKVENPPIPTCSHAEVISAINALKAILDSKFEHLEANVNAEVLKALDEAKQARALVEDLRKKLAQEIPVEIGGKLGWVGTANLKGKIQIP